MSTRPAEVESLVRATASLCAQRGYGFSPSKISRIVRRYVRQNDAGTVSQWDSTLSDADRLVVREIESAERFLRSVRIVLSGLPGLGKRR